MSAEKIKQLNMLSTDKHLNISSYCHFFKTHRLVTCSTAAVHIWRYECAHIGAVWWRKDGVRAAVCLVQRGVHSVCFCIITGLVQMSLLPSVYLISWFSIQPLILLLMKLLNLMYRTESFGTSCTAGLKTIPWITLVTRLLKVLRPHVNPRGAVLSSH